MNFFLQRSLATTVNVENINGLNLFFGLIFFFRLSFSLNGEWHTRHVASDCQFDFIGLFVVGCRFVVYVERDVRCTESNYER